jgi:hypothetical protein
MRDGIHFATQSDAIDIWDSWMHAEPNDPDQWITDKIFLIRHANSSNLLGWNINYKIP